MLGGEEGSEAMKKPSEEFYPLISAGNLEAMAFHLSEHGRLGVDDDAAAVFFDTLAGHLRVLCLPELLAIRDAARSRSDSMGLWELRIDSALAAYDAARKHSNLTPSKGE